MLLTTFVDIGICVENGKLGAPCSTELSDGARDALLWYELQRERSDSVMKLGHCLMFIWPELITEGSPGPEPVLVPDSWGCCKMCESRKSFCAPAPPSICGNSKNGLCRPLAGSSGLEKLGEGRPPGAGTG